ncbi:hypothetical protein EV426DRAFT_639464 [Tirmania nivea]|nr:hypothetical protein EV426DRAFT_639464 [Tirmania nivea]
MCGGQQSETELLEFLQSGKQVEKPEQMPPEDNREGGACKMELAPKEYPWTLKIGEYAKRLSPPMTTLKVGPDTLEHPAVELYVHNEVLKKLPFFIAALNGNFLEAATRVINMPEDNPEIVAKLMQFLYAGSYTIDEELIPPLPAAEKELDGGDDGDGEDIDDDADLPRDSEDERERLPTFRPWNRRPAMVAHVALPQIATPSGYPLGLISSNHTLPKEPDSEKSSIPSREYHHKLFHASVFLIAEKYDCEGLLMLSCKNTRKIEISDRWELLDYWVSIYGMSPPQSALRIGNSLSEKARFSYGVASTKAWIRKLWEDEGAGSGARKKEGKLTQMLAEWPELARDLLVLISGATK